MGGRRAPGVPAINHTTVDPLSPVRERERACERGLAGPPCGTRRSTLRLAYWSSARRTMNVLQINAATGIAVIRVEGKR